MSSGVLRKIAVREFKQLLRRRQRQHRLKNEFIFHPRIFGYSEVIYFITVKAIVKLNLGLRNKFEIEHQKISHHSSCSSDNEEAL